MSKGNSAPYPTRARALAALASALLAAWCPFASAQEADFRGQAVREVVFAGLRTVDGTPTVSRGLLLGTIDIDEPKHGGRKGEPKDLPDGTKIVCEGFDREVLNRDIKRLHELRFFSYIDAKIEALPGGLKITFTVVENVEIGEVSLIGLEELDEEELREKMRIKAGKPYSTYMADLDKHDIEVQLRDKGYPFAHVRYLERKKPPEDPTSVDVRFIADVGPYTSVERIEFVGNASFSASELKGYMQLEENSRIFWFWTEEFDAALLQKDLVNLQRFYQDRGFLDAKVALSDVRYSLDKRKMTVEIHVDEGSPYLVDKVDIYVGKEMLDKSAKHALFTRDELDDRLGLRVAMRFDREQMRKDFQAIDRLYRDNGRFGVELGNNVTVHLEDDPNTPTVNEAKTVSLVYSIDEGNRMFVNRVNIEGNELTREDVIRREIKLFPGDPLNQTKIDQSKKRLINLDYFSSIDIDAKPTADNAQKARDLLVAVTEKDTGKLVFAAGVNSNLGLSGEVSLTQENFDISKWPTSWKDFVSGNAFKGAGQFFQISLNPGTQYNEASITFIEPSFMGSPYRLGTRLETSLTSRDTHDERRIGGELFTGRRLPFRDKMRVDGGYSIEHVDVSSVDDDAPKSIKDVEGGNVLSALKAEYSWDERNDTILPSRGFRLRTGVELAGTFLGGDFDYVKNNYRAEYYHTTHKTKDGRPYILGIHGQLGLGFETGTDIPVFSRYFAGGFSPNGYSVRGFKPRSITPREGPDEDPVGGNYLAIANVEYSIPLVEEYIRLVTFTDVGSVGLDAGDLGSEVRASIGMGFRVKVPLFGPNPIALDFAVPLSKQDGDKTQVISFSFGRSF